MKNRVMDRMVHISGLDKVESANSVVVNVKFAISQDLSRKICYNVFLSCLIEKVGVCAGTATWHITTTQQCVCVCVCVGTPLAIT